MSTKAGVYKIVIVSFVCIGITSIAYGQESILIAPRIETTEYTPISGENGNQLESGIIVLRENKEIEALENQIKEREKKIQSTEKEIEGINQELNQIYKQKDTLEGELRNLTLTNKKNESQIYLTEENINKGKLHLQSLEGFIGSNTENIETIQAILIKNYRRSNEFEMESVDISFLLDSSLFEILRYIEEIDQYSLSLHEQLDALEFETYRLEKNKVEVIDEKISLQQQQIELEDRRKLYKFSIQNKEILVTQTKNSEVAYQELLNQKTREQLELQKEVSEYESRIEYLRDPESVPSPRKGLLQLPFEALARVTQNFGETSFAAANARKYGRPFHDGIDFGISSGTKLFASADGKIIGLGNTDVVRQCQSWGKWILIEHDFGLTTLYAHLSLIKVKFGQRVREGELIGYSGNTGFSTGAHLHFGVYDTNGIEVVPYERISSSSRCRGLLVPVAALDAKLDPRDYLAL